MPYAENLGNVGPTLDARYGSSSAINSNAPTLLDPRVDGKFVYVPGTAGNALSVPDATTLRVTGDLDVRVRVALDDWTTGASQTLLGKWWTTGNQRSYLLTVNGTGNLVLAWSTDGTAVLSATSTVALPTADGAPVWVKATLDVDNGLSQREIAFATSTNGITWTALGATVVQAGTTSVFSGGAAVEIGANNVGSADLAAGRFFAAQVYAGLTGTDVRLDLNLSTELTTGEEMVLPDTATSVIPASTQVLPNLGWGGQSLNARYGSTVNADTNDPQLITHDGTNFVYTPGTAGNYLNVIDTTALDITGDLDVRVRMAMDNWGSSTAQTLISKFGGGTTSSWMITVQSGSIFPNWTADGVTPLYTTITGLGALTAGQTYWVRFTFQANNGSGGSAWAAYYAPDSSTEPTAWTTLGVSNVTTTSLAVSNAPVAIGARGNGTTEPTVAKYFRAIIYAGLTGTDKRLDIDMTTGVVNGSEISLPFTGTAATDLNAGPYVQNLGSAGSLLPARYGSSTLSDSNDPLWLGHDGTNYLYLPGVAGNTASTSDSPALDITGDLEVVMRMAQDDWTPTSNNYPIGKRATATNQRSWLVETVSDGRVRLYWSVDGVSELSAISTASLPFADGQTGWIKVTLDVDNGAAGRDIKFWYAADQTIEPTVWTQLGTTVTQAGTTSIFSSNADVRVGGWQDGTSVTAAKYFRAIVRNGINGPTAFDVDFTTGITSGGQTAVPMTGTAANDLNAAYVSNLGTGGDALPTQLGSTTGADSNDPLWLSRSGESNLTLPGTANNYAVVPDNGLLDITGDIDLRVRVEMESWTPSTFQTFIGKWATSGQRSYYFRLLTAGTLQLAWTTDGTTVLFATSSVSVSPTTSALWLRCTRSSSTGDVIFYTSNDGATWTQLGTTQSSAASAIFSSTSAVALGVQEASNFPMAGKFYRAVIYASTNETDKRLDVDFSALKAGSTAAPLTAPLNADLSTAGFVSNLGWGGETLATRIGSTAVGDSNDPIWLPHAGINYLHLPGSGGQANRASAPSSTPLNVAGDIDIRINLTRRITGTQYYVAKWGAASQRSYLLYQGSDNLFLSTTPDGTFASRVEIGTSVTMATAGVPLNTPIWLRATRDVDNGAGGSTTRFYWATSTPGVEPTSWTQIGTDRIVAGTTSIFAGTDSFNMGTGLIDTTSANCDIYRVQVFASLTGTDKRFDANFTTGITSGGQTTFTESSTNAATVSINRATTGRRSVAVVQDTWLFGTDDYMQVANSPLLNFDAGQNFSVIAINRLWGTAGNETLISKKNNFATNDLGWAVGRSVTATRAQLGSDTSWYSSGVDAPGSYGALTLSGVVVTANSTMTVYNNTTAVNAASAPTGSFSNTFDMRIGSTPVGVYFNGELFAGAVFRRALTVAEITLINNYYQSGASPTEARALLAEAVWWIDADLSRQQAGIVATATYPRATVNTPNYLYLPGSTDNHVTSASSAALNVTDCDIRVLVSLQSTSADASLVAKRPWFARGVFDFRYNASNTLFLSWDASGVGVDVTSTAAGVIANQLTWLRVTRVFTGSGYTVVFYKSSDGINWTTISTHTGAELTATSNTDELVIGALARQTSALPLAGRVNRVQILSSGGGTVVFDANFSASLVSGSQTTFTESSANAATVTINRSTSGRKAVAVVDKPVWLFGTDDYMQVEDDPAGLLDFNATTSATWVIAARRWGATSNQYLFGKQTGDPGTGIQLQTAGGNVYPVIGAPSVNTAQIAFNNATPVVATTVLDRTNQTLVQYVGSTSTASVSTSTVGSLENSRPWRVGNGSGSFNGYADMEFSAGAIFRRALTQAEITLISNYYQYGLEATAAQALLGTAVWWIDSERSKAQVAINRSTSGRKSVAVVRDTWLLGTDDYFEVANHPLLNFGASESMTAVVAVRQWATPATDGRYLVKYGFGVEPGYAIRSNGTALSATSVIADGTNADSAISPTITAGALLTFALRLDRSAGTLTTYANGIAGTADSSLGATSLNNANPLRLGVRSTSTSNPQDFELFGAAIFRRALTQTEITTLNDYYQTGANPAVAQALLAESVWWIDANLSKPEAAINRTTSGRKSVATVRPTLLFGTDDWLEVADSDLLDFGATESLTFMVAMRQWATPSNFGRYIDKQTAGNVGYTLMTTGTAASLLGGINDGVNAANRVGLSTFTLGQATTVGVVVDRSAQTVASFSADTFSPTVSSASVGSLSNSVSLRIGNSQLGNYQDLEFFGAAIFRRALTAAEVTLLSGYYQSGTNAAAAQTLLRDAVFNIDPAVRAVAQINRANTGRKSVACVDCVWLLGADDYFEIPSDPTFNLTAAEEGTWLLLSRQWNTEPNGATLWATSPNTTTSTQGWAISTQTTGDPETITGRVGDGSTGTVAVAPAREPGQMRATVLVRSAGTLTAWTNSTEGTPAADGTGDLSNPNVVRIGRLSSTGTNYFDGELKAAAFWRRALSDQEISVILNYYGAL